MQIVYRIVAYDNFEERKFAQVIGVGLGALMQPAASRSWIDSWHRVRASVLDGRQPINTSRRKHAAVLDGLV